MLFRILALDLGKKRIGLAVSDLLGVTSQGLPTYHRKNLRADLLAIHLQAKELYASAILMGLPKSLKGEEAKQAQWVREFGTRLEERSGLPVFYWDERFTSVEAERVLKLKRSGPAGGKNRLVQKGQVDRLAAVLLLQSYLDAGSPGVALEEGAAPEDLSDEPGAGEIAPPEADLPEVTVPMPEPVRPRGGKRRHRAWDDERSDDDE
ncbi:MAG: Holliday junction resolvase RuvX [Bryobacterales bacterium]|nr:Holliday junction resolvase RuvX [Bryobacterales bacterium]